LLAVEPWKLFFGNFTFPYGFYDIEEYRVFLVEAVLVPLRVELFPKDMKLSGAEGLAGWIRTKWLHFTERLPAELKAGFIQEVVARYLERFPPDSEGNVHVGMMRLEVEATKP
jgi:trans-aconitate 2-methyltransferase